MLKKRRPRSSVTGPTAQPGELYSALDVADGSSAAGTSATRPAGADGIRPFVGLGGSAGGIAAMQEFFKAMPSDSGMASVFIRPLSPEHESTLPEDVPTLHADAGGRGERACQRRRQTRCM